MHTPDRLSSDPDVGLEASAHSRGIALTLAGLLGWCGAHRFYLGRPRSGVVMALTLGGCGLWYLYDLVVLGAGDFRDGQGRVVSEWQPEHGFRGGTSTAVLAELRELRSDVAELSERVAFTERLLAAPRSSEPPRRLDPPDRDADAG